MKKILYILLFIAGFQFNSNAQIKTVRTANDITKTVKFYPNPATSFINFEFDKNYDNSYSLLIFNFIGKKIEEIKVTDKKMTVSLSDYYRGIYVFQLRDKQGSIVESGKFQVVK
ncbi:MAG: T9SS type A sorting domain-containing protein [Ginsengibacter sp.]